jgi:hypothetical protein
MREHASNPTATNRRHGLRATYTRASVDDNRGQIGLAAPSRIGEVSDGTEFL